MTRDPRFDDLSGEFNETYFKQAYGFLSDIKLREKQVILTQKEFLNPLSSIIVSDASHQPKIELDCSEKIGSVHLMQSN